MLSRKVNQGESNENHQQALTWSEEHNDSCEQKHDTHYVAKDNNQESDDWVSPAKWFGRQLGEKIFGEEDNQPRDQQRGGDEEHD